MKTRVFIFLLLTISFFPTCSSDVYNPDICFSETILPVFVSKCSMQGCHNSADHADNYDFTTYDGIMRGVVAKHPLQSKVYNVIKGNNPSMPLGGGKLDAGEVSSIRIWIKMGAPNSSGCNSCDTSAYTYSGRIQPLMNTWCTGCHNAGTASGGYDLTDYAGVSAAVTGNRLLGVLNHTPGYVPMPENASKLSACDIDAVTRWIASGYPEN